MNKDIEWTKTQHEQAYQERQAARRDERERRMDKTDKWDDKFKKSILPSPRDVAGMVREVIAKVHRLEAEIKTARREERERCAKKAASYTSGQFDGEFIAARIREMEDEK